jgi:hypothetical protein
LEAFVRQYMKSRQKTFRDVAGLMTGAFLCLNAVYVCRGCVTTTAACFAALSFSCRWQFHGGLA